MLENKVLWQDLLPAGDLVKYPALNETQKADVCVIGAGYTGLSAALYLAEQGLSVVLLEAEQVGAGGSGRNVGLVNAGTWNLPDDLKKHLSEASATKLNDILSDAPRRVFELIDRYDIKAQDSRNGNLHMAHNVTGEQELELRYAQLQRLGAPVELIEGSRCHEYCGTQSVRKALLDKRAGIVNPYAYVNGLAKAATAAGVRLYEQTSVRSLEQQNGQWCVHTSTANQAVVLADKIIIASNAYTQGEWTDILKTIFFVNYYQIATVPLSGTEADKILPYKNGSWDTRKALSSIRRDIEGRLLLGTVGNFMYKGKLYLQWAETMLKHYFPALGKPEWQYHWSGRFGFTNDHLMRIFEPIKGVVAATAYNGRGITTGTVFGQALAEYLIHDKPDALPIPFKSIEESVVPYRTMRVLGYELGLSLYHAGQCLKIFA